MPKKLIESGAFFKKYNVPKDAFERTGLVWADLGIIYARHTSDIPNLQPKANFIADSLRQVREVHSLRIRIKEPEHLVEKIIRKKLEDLSLVITPDNYKECITDLIGVRVLHLFKDDWSVIHDFVAKTWNLNEQPIANVRKGDSDDYNHQFTEKGCQINEHKYGYRSVHYLIKSQPSKEIFIAELQVRTIFEEGWSEIDHTIRYPYDLGNVILEQISLIHNRLAGSADEISSFIKILKKELGDRDSRYAQALEEHDTIVSGLNAEIQKLRISEQQKEDLEKRLNSLSSKLIQDSLFPGLGAAMRTLAGMTFPVFDPSMLVSVALAAHGISNPKSVSPVKKSLSPRKPAEKQKVEVNKTASSSSSHKKARQKNEKKT